MSKKPAATIVLAASASAASRRFISIRWIVSGAAVVLTAATALGIAGLGERNSRRALTRELATRLTLQARNLATTGSRALRSESPDLTLQPILAEMTSVQPQLAFAVIVDSRGTIHGHAESWRLGTPFSLPELKDEEIGIALKPGERLLGNRDLLAVEVPVRNSSGKPIGKALIGFPRRPIDSVMEEARRHQAILLAALVAVGSTGTAVLMSRLLRPVATLRKGLERIGRGDLHTPVALKDPTEFGLLAQTMNEMASQLRHDRTEMVENERMARELELARQIQSSLLPAVATRIRGFVIDGSQRAAAEVGGDYYDVFPLPDGRIGVVIADVSKEGLAGCMITSMISVLLKAFRVSEHRPSYLMVRLENQLGDSLPPGTFITMFYGLLDPVTGQLTFASAGHNPTLVYRAGTDAVEWLSSRGIPIGAVRGGALAASLEDMTVDLEPGDLLLQYTDGINEASDPGNEQPFGFERLEKAVLEAAPRGCRAAIHGIEGAVEAWTGAQAPLDDQTLVVVSREGDRAGESTSSPDPAHRPALSALAEARRAGSHLVLGADLDSLTRIREWIGQSPGLERLDPRAAADLESGLYEVCANIVEHGYDKDPSKSFHLWWVSAPDAGAGTQTADANGGEAGSASQGGQFVIVDHGVPFQAKDRKRPNLADLAVRRRGRGLGLEIIYAAMSRVSYYPGTVRGNITLLGFDPNQIRGEVKEKASHV